MKAFKRVLSILLCSVMILCSFPVNSQAESSTVVPYAVEGGNIYFDTATGTVTDCDSSVTAAVIPESINGVSVTTIGEWAFSNAGFRVESISIPASVTEVNEAFDHLHVLKEIIVSKDNAVYASKDGVLFDKDMSTLLRYPNGKEDITYSIPDGVTMIGLGAFSDVDAVSIHIPSSVVGEYHELLSSFSFCDKLVEIVVADDNPAFESVDGVLFSKGMDHLIYYPEGKTDRSYCVPEGVTFVCGLRSLYLETIELPASCFSFTNLEGKRLKSIIVASDNIRLTSIDGVLYSKDGSELIQYPMGKAEEEKIVVIPDGVMCIHGSPAFEVFSNPLDVVIPASVAEIASYSFWGCHDTVGIDLYFKGNAPVPTDGNYDYGYYLGDFLEIYYVPGTTGWTDSDGYDVQAGTWYGHTLKTWDGVNIGEDTWADEDVIVELLDAELVDDQDGWRDYTVSLKVQNNSADGTLTNVKAAWVFDDKAAIQSGDQVQTAATIASNASHTFQWTVRVDETKYAAGGTWYYNVAVQADQFEMLMRQGEKLIQENKAIIILPGITGSDLYEKNGEKLEKKWLSAELFEVYCDATGEPVNPDIIAYEDYDDEIGTLGVFTDLYNTLAGFYDKGAGGIGTYEVEFFPYDWRLSNVEAAKCLDEFIRENNYTEVVLVAHSMGGRVSALYIDEYDADHKKVDKLITLGTPYYGAPKALNALATGRFLGAEDEFDIAWDWHKVDNLIIKDLGKNLPGLYELLPSKEYFNNGNYYLQLIVEPSIADPFDFEETYNYMKTAVLNPWFNDAVYQKACDVQDSLTSIYDDFKQGKTDTYVIVGQGVKTLSCLKAATASSVADLDVNLRGDGTVPLISATMNGSFPENRTYYVNGVDHTGLVGNEDTIRLVMNLIDGWGDDEYEYNQGCGNIIVRGDLMGEEEGGLFTGYQITNACPTEMTITDADGYLIGMLTPERISAKSGGHDNFYLCGEENEIKIAFVDEFANISIKGTDTGVMDLLVERYVDGEVVQSIEYTDVPVEAEMVIETNTDLSKNAKLSIQDVAGKKYDVYPDAVPTPETTPTPTPEVIPSPTPETTPTPTPEVTSNPTPEVMPTLTPETTPAPTPEVTPTPTLTNRPNLPSLTFEPVWPASTSGILLPVVPIETAPADKETPLWMQTLPDVPETADTQMPIVYNTALVALGAVFALVVLAVNRKRFIK